MDEHGGFSGRDGVGNCIVFSMDPMYSGVRKQAGMENGGRAALILDAVQMFAAYK